MECNYAKSLTMTESLLSGWESFYVIVGSSAAALTGLNFVVVALGADRGFLSRPGSTKASAVLSAPWPDVAGLGRGMDLLGIAGLIYVGIVLLRARGQTAYDPVLEDWIWHVILPIAAYATFLVAGLIFRRDLEDALFVVAGAALLLLYIGIHNAWDAATWLAIERPEEPESPTGNPPPAG